MFFITIGLILTTIFLLLRYRFMYWKQRGIPYLKPHFLYGNLDTFVQRKESFTVSAANLYNRSKEPVIGVFFFQRPTLLIRDADLVKQILVTDFHNFHDRGIHSNEEVSPISANLFSLEGEKWKNLRNNLTPTFTSGKLKQMFGAIDLIGERMLEYMDQELANKQEIIDVNDVARKYATDFIVSVFFGQDVNSFKDDSHVFAQVRDSFGGKGLLRNLASATLFLYPKLFDLLRLYKINEGINNAMLDVVKKTIEYREDSKTERHDFMQLLMQLQHSDGKRKLSINQITAQASLFLIAGLETTAATITFCLHELTQNDQVMKTLLKDIDETMEKHNGVLSYDAIRDMHYLEMVIQETVRKYPALPILNRICTKSFKVPNSNITIEEGTPLLISISGLQMDPQYFENPDTFDPERFREGKQNYKSSAFIPFGDGPRACIGMRQGKMSAKAMVVRILRNYTIKATQKSEIVFESHAASLSPKGGVKLKISKKNIN